MLSDGPTRLTTLAAKEGVGQPSMTQLIQRLERQDLVTRLADPEDGRAALVAITDAGAGPARAADRAASGTSRSTAGRCPGRGSVTRSGWPARVATPSCSASPALPPTGTDMGNSLSRRVIRWTWIPLVLIVVLAVSGLVVSRLHRKFASEDLNANAGAGIEIVQFNPKVLVYDVFGAPGTTARAQISYPDWTPEANLHHLDDAPLPRGRPPSPRRCRASAPTSWCRATAGSRSVAAVDDRRHRS